MKNYDVDPDKLTSIFDNKTATYKYFWFLALLDNVRLCRAHGPIPFADMVARMVSKAWVPLTSHTFSFGKCDALLPRIQTLIHKSELKDDDIEVRVYSYIAHNAHEPLICELISRMTNYVPYRFLYPWLSAKMSNRDTARASLDFEKHRCIYGIKDKTVIVNPAWIDYLTDHVDILEAFARFHLLLYLKRYNKNVILPDEKSIHATADGYSLDAFSWSACRVAESSSNNDAIDDLRNRLRETEKLNRAYQKMFSLLGQNSTHQTIINGNVGQAIGKVDKVDYNEK